MIIYVLGVALPSGCEITFHGLTRRHLLGSPPAYLFPADLKGHARCSEGTPPVPQSWSA